MGGVEAVMTTPNLPIFKEWANRRYIAPSKEDPVPAPEGPELAEDVLPLPGVWDTLD